MERSYYYLGGVELHSGMYVALIRQLEREAKDKLDRWIADMEGQGRVRFRWDAAKILPAKGLFVPPTIAELDHARARGRLSDLGYREVDGKWLSKEEYEKRNIPARRFFDAYQKEYGEADPDPYAIFGYETMSLILEAIERAGDKGNDRLRGGSGEDALLGLEGADTLLGGANFDVIRGFRGHDNISGGGGGDLLDGGPGNDRIDGGDGWDSCTRAEQTLSCES